MSREMIDSGIAWIGEIPKGWRIAKFKNLSILYNGNSLDEHQKEYYSTPYNNQCLSYISTKDISRDVEGIEYQTGLYIPKGEEGFSVAPQNSILLCIEGGSAGRKVAFVNQKVCFVNKLCCISSMTEYNRYLYYFVLSHGFTEPFFQNMQGLIGGVSVSSLKNFYFPLPPLTEQHSIADFLDKKCAEIDELVSIQEKFIEELKAYKQSVITETVTKGLNPNVQMKDSGVEWIGEIPKGWKVERFKDCASVKANLVHPEDYLDYPQIAPDNIEKGGGLLHDVKTVMEANVISDNHLFFKGQIIYSKIRPVLNKVVIAPFDGLCSADMYPIETSQNTTYLRWLMLSNTFVAQVALVVQDRVKMPKINQEELSAIWLPLPPLSEQQAIADYLDRKCAEIDKLIAVKQKKIDELKTYKKSIIYEYVTGKKEVYSN